MVRGARSSCRETGKAPDFAVADAGRLPIRSGSVHGIATDPPYGRAASTRGEPVDRLYERAFDAFVDVLNQGARVAVVLPTEKAIGIGMARMELAERHALRVHRSLARHFCVFVKA